MKKLFTLLCSLIATTAFAQFLGAGKGTESNPYQIENTEQFNSLRGMDTSDKYFVLTADIDMTEWLTENNPKNGWAPIPGFSGNLNGQNHFIKSYINRPKSDNIALIGWLYGTIQNVNVIVDFNGQDNVSGLAANLSGDAKIRNCNIEGIINGNQYVGGIVGYCITDCVIDNCSVNGNIKGIEYIGGIAGYFGGHISKCSFDGTIIGDDSCGGIVGESYFSSYYNSGWWRSNVSTITNCINTGTIIAANYNVAGIVGFAHTCNITACINKGYIEGTANAGGIAGCLVGDLQNNSYLVSVLKSNVSIGNVSVKEESAARIVGKIGTRTEFGAIGTNEENKALNTLIVTINGEEQDIDGDDAFNGANYGQRTLKQASAYTSIGWDMQKVWTINNGKDYPNLIMEPMGTPNFKSEYEEVAAPTISVGEGTISFSCELDDPTYYYRISFNDESYKFSSTKEPVALPTSFTLSVYATGEGLTTPTTVENIELSQLLNDGNLNGDDAIDITDVTILVNKILEKSGESEE